MALGMLSETAGWEIRPFGNLTNRGPDALTSPIAGAQPPKQPDADVPEMDELWFFAGRNGTSKGSFYFCDVRVVFTVYAPHLSTQV